MKKLVLDIETLPVDINNAPAVAYLVGDVSADSRLKDAEKIAADIASKQTEAISKTGLDGAFGRVLMATIGDLESGELITVASDTVNEGMVLAGLLETLAKFADGTAGRPTPLCIIGHNISWDIRFLVQRCAVHGLRVDGRLLPFNAKPWDGDKMVDTMIAWAGVGGKIKLDRLCVALGIESPKGEMDGSQVAAFFAAGRFDDIVTYNRADVLATMRVYRKLAEAGLV